MGTALHIRDVDPAQVTLEVTEMAFVDNSELIGQRGR